MLSKTQFLFLMGLSVLVLIVVVTDAALVISNRASQAEVSNRQQYIQQSLQLEPIYQALIKALAELSESKSDEALRQILATQGINVTAAQQPAQGME